MGGRQLDAAPVLVPAKPAAMQGRSLGMSGYWAAPRRSAPHAAQAIPTAPITHVDGSGTTARA